MGQVSTNLGSRHLPHLRIVLKSTDPQWYLK